MSIENQEEKLSYAIGLSLASNMLQSGIKSLNLEKVFEAIGDVMNGQHPKITPQEANQIIEQYFKNKQETEGADNAKTGAEFMANNKKEAGVIELESGLQYKIIKHGNGAKPTASDKVSCHYHGTLVDGSVFDSSVQRNQPAEFPVNGVIKGWIEALQMMPEGSKWQLYVPPHLAYGDQGAGGIIGPKATLIFDVELLEILK